MLPMLILPARPGSSPLERVYYPASGRHGGGGAAAPRDRAASARTMAQDSRAALNERLCLIEIQRQPAPWGRDIVPVYGELAASLPVVRAGITPASVGRGEVLLQIRAFAKQVRMLRGTGARAFTPMRHCWKVTQVGVALLAVMGDLFELAQLHHQDRRFDWGVQLAVDEFAAVGLITAILPHMLPSPNLDAWRLGYVDPVIANLSNAFIKRVRERANAHQAGRVEQLHKTRNDALARELRSYFSDLVRQHPSAHVERLELTIQGPYQLNQRDNFKRMVDATTRLLKALKHRYGSAIVGDIRKVDHAPKGDYLVHLLLAVEGPSASELEDLRRAIRELWDEMFPDHGIVVDCNDFELFMYRGCGTLIRPHESLKGQLDKATIFLAETDRMIRIGYGEGHDGLLIGTVSGRPLP
ncbi:hypothetical protein [Variovorax sp. Root411]|uniref:hypothetical protein n=1 Tax=Variovorax sp. Root411 TaxID=1736530 RepID=UPI000AF6534C|nr:hypothetical protein [Variovorax sp. Root411]